MLSKSNRVGSMSIRAKANAEAKCRVGRG
jgi:hypothetical protein